MSTDVLRVQADLVGHEDDGASHVFPRCGYMQCAHGSLVVQDLRFFFRVYSFHSFRGFGILRVPTFLKAL